MYESLNKLADLPPDTLVYCAHEYTLSNCRFAQAVEPDNAALKQRTQAVEAARRIDKITIPSTLEEELAVNPFLRCDQKTVVDAAQNRQAGIQPGAATLAVIRSWKDNF